MNRVLRERDAYLPFAPKPCALLALQFSPMEIVDDSGSLYRNKTENSKRVYKTVSIVLQRDIITGNCWSPSEGLSPAAPSLTEHLTQRFELEGKETQYLPRCFGIWGWRAFAPRIKKEGMVLNLILLTGEVAFWVWGMDFDSIRDRGWWGCKAADNMFVCSLFSRSLSPVSLGYPLEQRQTTGTTVDPPRVEEFRFNLIFSFAIMVPFSYLWLKGRSFFSI